MKYLVQANPTNQLKNYRYTFQVVSRDNWEMHRTLKYQWNAL